MPEIHLSHTLLLHGTGPAAGHFLSGYITCMKFHVDVPKLLLPVNVCLIHFRQSRTAAIAVCFHISQRLRNDLLPFFSCSILDQISCHFLFLACLSFTATVSQPSVGCKLFPAFSTGISIARIRKAGTIKCPGYQKDTIGTNI